MPKAIKREGRSRQLAAVSLMPEVVRYTTWLDKKMGERFSTSINSHYMRRMMEDMVYQEQLARGLVDQDLGLAPGKKTDERGADENSQDGTVAGAGTKRAGRPRAESKGPGGAGRKRKV